MRQTNRKIQKGGAWKQLLALSLFVGLVFSGVALASPSSPKRIVSFDLCVDQLLLEIVPKENIAALTFLTSDSEYSTQSQKAKELPITNGSVEDVFKYKADLVLVGQFESQTKIQLLKSLGFNVQIIPSALSDHSLRETIKKIGHLTGYEENADVLIKRFDLALEHLTTLRKASNIEPKPRAIFLASRRHTQGENSVVNSLLDMAGFTNIATETGLKEGGFIGLETLIQSSPDLMLISKGKIEAPSLATNVLSHPAMIYLGESTKKMEIEQKHLLCLTPKIVDAAMSLVKARGGDVQ